MIVSIGCFQIVTWTIGCFTKHAFNSCLDLYVKTHQNWTLRPNCGGKSFPPLGFFWPQSSSKRKMAIELCVCVTALARGARNKTRQFDCFLSLLWNSEYIMIFPSAGFLVDFHAIIFGYQYLPKGARRVKVHQVAAPQRLATFNHGLCMKSHDF